MWKIINSQRKAAKEEGRNKGSTKKARKQGGISKSLHINNYVNRLNSQVNNWMDKNTRHNYVLSARDSFQF